VTPTSTPTTTPTATDTPRSTATPSQVPPTPTPAALYLPLVFAKDPCPPPELFSDVVLVLDSSTSMLASSGLPGRSLRDVAREAALAFIDGLLALRRPDGRERLDQIAIVNFDRTAHVRQRFTRERSALERAVDTAYEPVRGSSLDDALSLAVAQFDDAATAVASHRRVMIVLTDGFVVDVEGEEPGSSVQAVRDMATQARKDGITIYAVGLGTTLDEQLLRSLASSSDRSGAHYIAAYAAENLVAIYADLSRRSLCPEEIYMR
jgi:Mg-chelatase subunit ChlD